MTRPRCHLRLRAKLALLAALWFVHLPAPAALGSTELTDEEATIALLDLGCQEVTGSSWLPFWLNL